jgi:hypothetical protein
MSKQSQTLIYFVGGLAYLGNTSEYPFENLYHHLEKSWKQAGKSPTSFNARLHSFRQSTCIPIPRRRTYASAIPVLTDQTSADLANQIDEAIERERREIKATEIVIVAYSAGSALVRRAILQAKDREWKRKKLASLKRDDPNSVTCGDKSLIASDSWSEILTKVIHIGGMTVGWEFNSQMPKHYLWLGPILRPFCPYWFPWQIYRGSKFITDTRIGLNQHQLDQTHQTFYLLGTQDQFLSPADAVEPGGRPGNDPIYLEVAGFDHNSILNYADHQSEASESQASKLDQILKIIIEKQDIIGSIKVQNLAMHIPQEDIDDYLNPMDSEPARRNDTVEHVVIVLHGIRDSGFWAKRIAHRIKKAHQGEKPYEKNKTVKVVSLGYGYFSLWDFLRPGGRRQAVEWFQNVYADITALYPRADVSFIGHSNGTYLGTHALQCENVKFRYLVLAGSVVRSDFWDTKGKDWQWTNKVDRLLNIQGVDDWIVGLLPGGLEAIPILGKWMDLGGLGAYGNPILRTYKNMQSSNHENVDLKNAQQIMLVGNHGVGISDTGWDYLARFVLMDDPLTAKFSLSNAFKLVDEPKQLHCNRVLHFTRPIGGIYIYIAILFCFSPILQLLWIWLSYLFKLILPKLSPEGVWQLLIEAPQVITELPQSMWAGLQTVFTMPHVRAVPENQLAIWLFSALAILVFVGLILNVLRSFRHQDSLMEENIELREKLEVIKGMKLEGYKTLEGKYIESEISSLEARIRMLPSLLRKERRTMLYGIVGIVIAIPIANVVATLLQEFQTVMALLLVLSILSFSLLKRI